LGSSPTAFNRRVQSARLMRANCTAPRPGGDRPTSHPHGTAFPLNARAELPHGPGSASYCGDVSDHLSIQEAIDRLLDGTIRIPGFQRKFVWPPQRCALLMDSIYKGYPVGSILLWRTGQRLKRENRLGTFELPPPDKDYPVDYVLDGQQRLTAIFTSFQYSLSAIDQDDDAWLPIYYDFEAVEDAQDSRFVALSNDQVESERHFPLKTFLEPVEFSLLTRNLSADRHREIARVQQKFLSLLVPVQTFETEDRQSVAIVFERVNRMGIPLDTYQLLTAWTWSDEFDLQERFQALADEFSEFGFEEVGDDSELMMRCTAAVLSQDPSPTALVTKNGGEVRDAFPVVESAIRLAIDFVRHNFGVRHIKFLPYSSLLIPLAAFFSIDQNKSISDNQRAELCRWFWRSCFSHRYSGNPQRNIRRDLREAMQLRTAGSSDLANVAFRIDPGFFLQHGFTTRTVATKSMILLLASTQPKSFLSGQPVPLEEVLSEPNRREYHHCYPRAYLTAQQADHAAINCLANFAMISRADNREISAKAPSEYRKIMPADVRPILAGGLLPASLFEDNYPEFLVDRSAILMSRALDLCGAAPASPISPPTLELLGQVEGAASE